MKTAYIKHPTKQQDVEKAVSGGYRVIDLKFKPNVIGDDDIVLGEEKPKPKRESKSD